MEEELTGKVVGDKVLIIGLGNRLKSDDGAGSILAERLKKKLDAKVIDAGVSLENYTGPIIKEKPETVLLIDAVNLNKEAGTIEIIDASETMSYNFSTHGMHISFFINYLKEHEVDNIVILGIQPEKIELGENIGKAVERAMDEIETILMKIIN